MRNLISPSLAVLAAQGTRDHNRLGTPEPERQVRIVPFNLENASDHDYAAFAAFRNRIRAEQLPEDPPIPRSEFVSRFKSASQLTQIFVWVAWDADRKIICASGGLDYQASGENAEIAIFRIAVLPELRRRGLARRLLRLITEVAQRENRLCLIGNTSRVEAGAIFMQLIGATKGLESHINQLALNELRRDVLDDGLEDSRRKAKQFELLFWSGAYPENCIPDIAALHDVTNHQPHGSLPIKDMHFSPAHVRALEQTTFANGSKRWSLCVREKASGMFAGFTEVYWHPNRPSLIQQGFTGVFPQYRNRGLGRWLKTEMLEKIIKERPQVKHIRTGNADSNTAMVKINQKLGFRPYASQCVWQVETTRVAEYLAARA